MGARAQTGAWDAVASECVFHPLRLALTVPERLRGLIGRDPMWLGVDGVLLLAPCNSVHTFYLKHNIDVAFIDKRGRVLRSHEDVRPNRVLACRRACATVERFTPAAALGAACGACEQGVTPWPSEGMLANACLHTGARSGTMLLTFSDHVMREGRL